MSMYRTDRYAYPEYSDVVQAHNETLAAASTSQTDTSLPTQVPGLQPWWPQKFIVATTAIGSQPRSTGPLRSRRRMRSFPDSPIFEAGHWAMPVRS